MTDYGHVVFDIDGTLLLSSRPLHGAARCVAACRRAGLVVSFVTNMSVQTPQECLARLVGAGVAAERDEVITAAMALADEVARRAPARLVYRGGPGLQSALAERGLGGTPLGEVTDPPDGPGLLALAITPDVTEDDLARAEPLVRAGWPVLVASLDRGMPIDGGFLPGTGALVARLAERVPLDPIVCGKPGAPIARLARARRADGRATLVVGDSLEADVALAAAAGWDAVLVRTGIDGDAVVDPAAAAPAWVVDSLDDVLPILGLAAAPATSCAPTHH